MSCGEKNHVDHCECNELIENIVKKAVESGHMQIIGYNKDGEAIYKVTPEGAAHSEKILERIDRACLNF